MVHTFLLTMVINAVRKKDAWSLARRC